MAVRPGFSMAIFGFEQFWGDAMANFGFFEETRGGGGGGGGGRGDK